MGAVAECRSESPGLPSSLVVDSLVRRSAAFMNSTSVFRERPWAEGLRMWKRGSDGSDESSVSRGGRCAFKWLEVALAEEWSAIEALLIAFCEAAGDSLRAERGAARAESWVGDRGRPCCEVIFAVLMERCGGTVVFRSPRGRFGGAAGPRFGLAASKVPSRTPAYCDGACKPILISRCR